MQLNRTYRRWICSVLDDFPGIGDERIQRPVHLDPPDRDFQISLLCAVAEESKESRGIADRVWPSRRVGPETRQPRMGLIDSGCVGEPVAEQLPSEPVVERIDWTRQSLRTRRACADE